MTHTKSLMAAVALAASLTVLAAPLVAEGADGARTYAADTIPNPTTAGTGYVTSIGGYLSDGEVAELNALITGIEADTTAEIAVVVVPALSDDIFTAAQALFDAWGIGKKSNDNGILIIASIEDRDFRTHVGYGMEGTLTDAGISLLQESVVIPAFKEGRYGDGLVAYVSRLGEVLRDPSALAEIQAQSESKSQATNPLGVFILLVIGAALCLVAFGVMPGYIRDVRSARRRGFTSYERVVALETKSVGKPGFALPACLFPLGGGLLYAGLAALGASIAQVGLVWACVLPGAGFVASVAALIWRERIRRGIIARWRSDPRACPECGQPMAKLSEVDDDRYLAPFQITEEKLKSSDYDVWVCAACATATIEKYRGGRYALYTACPTCGGLTAKQTRRVTLTPPTYVSAGVAQLQFACLSCAATFTKDIPIPKLTASSGGSGGKSGGGGGSSFGGGRSGGGGSTSHW